MLRPTKHTNPKLSVLNASAIVLQEIKKKRIVSHADIMHLLEKQLGENFRPDFPAYVGFLFLLGKIAYAEKTDSFIYLED